MTSPKLAVLIYLLLGALIFGGYAIAQGSILKQVPATLNIITGLQNIEVYQNAAMTIPMTSANFSDMGRGSYKDLLITVGNSGNASVFVNMRPTENISEWGDWRVYPTGGGWVRPPNGFQQFIFRILLNHDAPLGAKNFNIEIYKVE